MTLTELILVMALLATVLAFSAPSLSRFMRGRDLTEETRRFLALARYARSEAASRAQRMEIYLEPETGIYGLTPEGQAESEEEKTLEFQLANGLRFDVDPEACDDKGRATILFLPDGWIDEGSLETLRIVETEDERKMIEIVRSKAGTNYVVGETATNE